MKKYIILLSLVPSILVGQNLREYSVHFSPSDFTYEKNDSIVHIASKVKDTFIWGDCQSPALPWVKVNILVAPFEQYERAIEKSSEVLVLTDGLIEPNPIPLPTNTKQQSEIEMEALYDKDVYPNINIEYTGTHLMDGYKYISFVVCPFRYDAVNKRLYLKRDITIQLELSHKTEKTDAHLVTKNSRGNNMHEIVSKLVINGSDMESLYSTSTRLLTNDKSFNSTAFDYIIVTKDSLRATFDELAKWKTIKGVKSKVITVEECCNEFPTATPQLAIKSKLSECYNSGMEYVLLGGDTEIVPAQICYLPHWTERTYNTPADLYYACMDNCFSWDADGNQVYGETSDNIDLDPEFIVTRVSVSNKNEAEVFVNRILEYESSPKLDEWTNSLLSFGNILYGYRTKNNTQISDVQWQGEYVYETGIQPYWNGTVFKLFDTYTDHQDGASYQVNENHIQTELEKGYTFVDEFSHAFVDKWGYFEDSTLYRTEHASDLVNRGYSIITTISCYSNAFDYYYQNLPLLCMSEAFIRNPNSGVLAYFGSSREGWASFSYYFDEKFYEYLLDSDDKQFGRAAMYAKNAYLSNVSSNTYNYYKWLIMTLNPIGDPEMPVYSDTPQHFSNVNVSISNGNLSVTTGVSDCRICVSSVADNGISYYNIVNNTTNADFIGVIDDCYLCITKPGYIPYVARVGSSVYLQNETIIKNLPVFSTTTFVGSDVTTSKPQGAVSIDKGKLTNKSHGDMTIKNNFEVKLGAELEISN